MWQSKKSQQKQTSKLTCIIDSIGRMKERQREHQRDRKLMERLMASSTMNWRRVNSLWLGMLLLWLAKATLTSMANEKDLGSRVMVVVCSTRIDIEARIFVLVAINQILSPLPSPSPSPKIYSYCCLLLVEEWTGSVLACHDTSDGNICSLFFVLCSLFWRLNLYSSIVLPNWR